MTRLEWFDLQPKCIQEAFKNNCNNSNSNKNYFDWWIKQDNNSNGIMGAFAFDCSIEGWDFWLDIDTKMHEFSKYTKVC